LCSLAIWGATSSFAATSDHRIGFGANAEGDLSINVGLSGGRVFAAGLTLLNQADNTKFRIFGSYDHPLHQGEHASLNLEPRLSFESSKGSLLEPGLSGLAAESDGNWTAFQPGVGLKARVWVGRNISLSGVAGLYVRLVDPPSGDSETIFGTYSSELTEFTFTYWLDRKAD
jgi:hypothetical protein